MRRRLPWAVAAFWAWALCASASAAVSTTAGAPADSVTIDAPPAPWTVRGTAEPLTDAPSAPRRVLRAAGLVPYSAVWLIARPPVALINWDERHGYSRKVMSWFTRDVEVVNTTVAAFLGYESGFGVTVLGVRVHSKDWYGTGLENRFRFSYLNPSKNIVEIKLSGSLTDDSSFNTRTRFRRTQDRDFYGFGQVDDAPDSEFDSQLFLNEVQIRRRLSAHTDAALSVYSRATRLREHGEESLRDASPELWARAAHNRYFGLEAEARRDTRDHGEMSSSGVLARAAAGWNFARVDDDSDYRHVTAEFQAHHPLFRDRILAMRLFYEGVDADSARRLPFSELRALGGHHDLRGYGRDRFMDKHLLAASLEYRYPVTLRFQGRLFADWGTVAPTIGDLDLSRLAWSMGLGLAVQLSDDDLFIMQVAGGAEGAHVYVGTSTPFGYASRRKR